MILPSHQLLMWRWPLHHLLVELCSHTYQAPRIPVNSAVPPSLARGLLPTVHAPQRLPHDMPVTVATVPVPHRVTVTAARSVRRHRHVLRLSLLNTSKDNALAPVKKAVTVLCLKVGHRRAASILARSSCAPADTNHWQRRVRRMELRSRTSDHSGSHALVQLLHAVCHARHDQVR